MKKNAKELLCTCGIALLLMLSLAFVFRVWMMVSPPPPRPATAEKPAELTAFAKARARDLLRKPLAEWTPHEREVEPELHAWLESVGRKLLPWEWSQAARGKDPEGHAKAWGDLFSAERKKLESSLEKVEQHTVAIRKDIADETLLRDHATDQIARVEAILATNAYPATVMLETLKKGLLWGWNRGEESLHLADDAAGASLMATLVSNRNVHVQAIAANEAVIVEDDRDGALHRTLLASIEHIVVEKTFSDENATLDALASCIRFTERRRHGAR
ncbi:MAG: hypothetical protein IKO72_09260 [Kiritimatiellae bacterium]|nr:hypothetical protein [Kiritimatiellia bacterium]